VRAEFRDWGLRRRFHSVAVLLATSIVVAPAHAVRAQVSQTSQSADGTVVEEWACPPRPKQTYAQYVGAMTAAYRRQLEAARKLDPSVQMPADSTRFLLSSEEFSRRESYSGIDCRRIRYMSDGLKVVGYIWRPRVSAGKTFPLVIFNRGGNRERSQLTPWMADGFYDFVSRGFVVIASQYRGVDGGEGREEYGGADVRDVMNLLVVAKSLGIVDLRNVFVFGNSRGGMMTYLALKHGLPVNAAAVTSGVTDLFGNATDHPELVTSIYEQLIPDFGSRRDAVMAERSATQWADKIDVPLLILHGAADTQISAVRALEFAQRLQSFGKTYELVVYANDGHGLPMNKHDSDRRVIEWFRKHLR
jgi:dipeptidyl aminopeptidase/acylaminoacyl peptidase